MNPQPNPEITPRIIEVANERGEFVKSDDGYTYWWPTPNQGMYPANALRELAHELDARNAEWDKKIEEYFAKEGNIFSQD